MGRLLLSVGCHDAPPLAGYIIGIGRLCRWGVADGAVQVLRRYIRVLALGLADAASVCCAAGAALVRTNGNIDAFRRQHGTLWSVIIAY